MTGTTRVRATFGRPLRFTLEPLPGPPAGSLTRDVLEDVADAQELRDAGRYEQAVSAYLRIQRENPRLSFVHLVLAGMYRERAEQEPEPAARQELLERAAAAYREVLADGGAEDTLAARELATVTDALGNPERNTEQ